jgi:hypothetical protein
VALVVGPDAAVTARLRDDLNRARTRLRRAGQVSERAGSCGVPWQQAKQATIHDACRQHPRGLALSGNVSQALDGCPRTLGGTGRRTVITSRSMALAACRRARS